MTGRCAIGAGWLLSFLDAKPPGSARRIGHDQQRGSCRSSPSPISLPSASRTAGAVRAVGSVVMGIVFEVVREKGKDAGETGEVDVLNELGEQGWELVAIAGNQVAYLKRRSSSPTPPKTPKTPPRSPPAS
jgi:hypothetical protein